ncbi:MAG: squalene/phytoene synthase family protein [Pseudomonadota bacterium]
MTPERFAPLSPDDAAYLLGEAERFEPDWLLVLPYVPTEVRGAWLALLGFFAEALTIPDRVSNPMLGAIRLAWWREAVGEVYGEGVPRKHPVVLALTATVSERPAIRPFLENALGAIEPFLEPGDDTDLEAAISRRVSLYGAIAGAFGVLDGSDNPGGEALTYHALAKVTADPSAAATAEGPEPMARRFARALAAKPDLAFSLNERILAFRRESGKGQPLAALPFALVRSRRRHAQRALNPLLQRLLVFKAVLTGSY